MAIFLKAGTRVLAYIVARMLGSGGEGDTYLATDARGRHVVLKQNHPTPDLRQRVERRSVLIGKHHPNVVEFIEYFVYEGLTYEVYEWVDGDNLREYQTKEPHLSLTDILTVAMDVLFGLVWLHDSNKIVHRDIKPDNVMIFRDADDRLCAKVIDLGIAFHGGMSRLTTKFAGATLEYAPPEQLFGHKETVDGRTDLYSLGVLVFELVSRRPLYTGFLSPADALKIVIEGKRPRLVSISPDTPKELSDLVYRLTEPKPDNRPNSAVEVLEQFRLIAEEFGPGPPSKPRPKPRPKPGPGPSSKYRDPSMPCLEILSGPNKGLRIDLPKNGIALGRAILNPSDELISRSHLSARPYRKTVLLKDIGSTNHIVVRDRRTRRIRLAHDESFAVGNTTLIYRRKGD